MSLWSQIKYAMNSTLGTSEFKPLDKIIEGQRTWGASDTTIKILAATFSASSEAVVGTFTPKVGGSIRIAAELVVDDGSFGGNLAYLNIYTKDGIRIGSTSATGVYNKEVTMNVDIPITANATYTVKAYRTLVHNSFKNIRVCGNLIDASLMK